MKVTEEQNKYFAEIADDIVNHVEYQKLKNFTHHLCMTRYEHCMHVAYRAYLKALKSKKQLDLRSLIRGALLHDFYFYQREEAPKMHLQSHPMLSVNNAKEYFELNELEIDIMKSHMWPVNSTMPKYKESRIVNKADKVSSMTEVVKIKKKFLAELRIFLDVYQLA
ncbi:MAG: HD domain-containing protein [bacterium]